MPTEQSVKNKAKKADKTKTTVKSEPTETELKSISQYIDDRAELMTQIFAILKSKTIKSIAPEFLQDKSLDSIQKHCLEELVGISKKRLLSIINATKCPSDTESSDSDVENIEEHISLEEISSDSEAEKVVVKKKKTKTKNAQANKKDATAADNKPPKKEVSVLELLELQARARAIRSQLALEPVTKIELDSDNSDKETSSEVSATKPSTMIKTSEQLTTPPPSTAPKPSQNNGTVNVSKPAATTVSTTQSEKVLSVTIAQPKVRQKPIRLKRNFRQRQMDGYDEDAEADELNPQSPTHSQSANEKSKESESFDSLAPESPKSQKSDSRCSSPDVITIIPSPETLLISSDSEGEDHQSSSKIAATQKFMTNLQNVVQLPETEDEYFLRKIKEANGSGNNSNDSATNEIGNENLNPSKSGEDKEMTGEDKSEKFDEPETAKEKEASDDELIDPEDGEIFEESDDDEGDDDNDKSVDKECTETEDNKINETDDKTDETEIQETEVEDNQKDEESQAEVSESTDKLSEKITDDNEATVIDDDDDSVHEKSVSSSSSSSSSSASEHLPQSPKINEIDDDEDIIDLGKDEDFEMKIISDDDTTEKIDEPTKVVEKKKKKRSCDDEIASNSQNDAESESWGTRWLRGSKVTKIMATSKLANKVRTKIKNQKKEQEALLIAAAHAAAAEKLDEIEREKNEQLRIEKENSERLAGLEDGSVKQYEVLKDTNTTTD